MTSFKIGVVYKVYSERDMASNRKYLRYSRNVAAAGLVRNKLEVARAKVVGVWYREIARQSFSLVYAYYNDTTRIIYVYITVWLCNDGACRFESRKIRPQRPKRSVLGRW